MATTTNGALGFSVVSQVVDGTLSPSYKWFSLQNNKLDGTYHPISSIGDYQIGWWGTVLSDSSGNFVTKPVLTTDAFAVIHTLLVIGDDKLGEYPKGFKIRILDAGVEVFTTTVINNASTTWKLALPRAYKGQIELTVNTWSHPNRAVKILETSQLFELARVEVVQVSGTSPASSAGISIIDADIGSITSQEAKTITVTDTSAEIAQVSETHSTTITVTEISTDTGIVRGTETSQETIQDVSVDTAAISIVETDSLQVSFTKDQSLTLSGVETDTLIVTTSRLEVDNVSISEDTTVIVSLGSEDSGTISSATATTTTGTFTRPEAGTVTGETVTNITVSVPGGGVEAIAAQEGSALTVQIARQDSTKVSLNESTFFSVLEKWKQDSSNVTESHSKQITVNVFAADQGILQQQETRKVTNSFNSSDSGSLVKDPEFVLVLGHGSSDSGTISVTEEVLMTNVHTRVDEAVRRVYGKVEITYTDPFLDTTVLVTSSGDAYGTSARQTADNLNSKYKWFGLSNNKLDGTFHPILQYGDYQHSAGWWSDVVSDSLGVFKNPVSIMVEFEPRSMFDLKVVGDALLNEYPVDFTVTLYDVNNIILQKVAVVGNTEANWIQTLPQPVLNVARMFLSITKVNRPKAPAKITELFSSIKETYTDDALIAIDLLEEQVYNQPTIPIGNISSNEINVRLDNTSRKFDSMNTDSALASLLKKNRKIRPYLGIEVLPGEIEWHPMGVFWSIDWNAPTWDVYAEVIGRDQLELLRLTTYSTSVLQTDVSLYTLAEQILLDSGLTPSDYYIDPNLQNMSVSFGWIPKVSHRDALALVAAAALGRCYCDRDGKVVVEAFIPESNSVYAFTNENSIIDSNHPVAWGQVANEVSVEYYSREVGLVEELYRNTEPLTVPAGEVVTLILEVNDGPITDVRAPEFDKLTGMIVTYEAFSWGMAIDFDNTNDIVAKTVNSVVFTGRKLLKSGKKIVTMSDAKSIRDNGKQSFTISSDLIQTESLARRSASRLLETYKDPRHDAVLDTRGNIALRLGQRVTIPGYKNKSVGDYILTRQQLYWEGYLESKVTAQKIGGTQYEFLNT